MVFPAQLLLVAAMNPCPCGYAGDTQRPCACSPKYITSYTSRLSGPLLDRIDLHVPVPRLPWQEWQKTDNAEISSAIRERVILARQKQAQRLGAGRTNSSITPSELKRFASVDIAGEKLLGQAVERLGLSGRSISRILKLSRTIADLSGADNIAASYIAEALQYRPSVTNG
jgi:magnesium chelatase family protein